MERPNPLREKSYAYALDIVKFYKILTIEKKEYVLSKQLLKSGTSIGANVAEGLSAPTKKDFAHTLSIALKEARECHYWLSLLRDGLYTTPEEITPLLQATTELIALLTAIIKTSRQTLVG